MRLTRQTFIIGGAALVLAAVLLGGLAFNPGRTTSDAFAGGYGSPDPTIDPCLEISDRRETSSELVAAQQPNCTPTEETLPRTHTPTPRPTDEPTEEPTDVPATNTTVPATNTPTGGAGAGGLRPPNTGTGGDERHAALQWLLVAGALAAGVAGVSSLGYGIRRK